MCVLGVFCGIKVVFRDIILCCKIWFTQLFEMKHIAKNTLFGLQKGPCRTSKRGKKTLFSTQISHAISNLDMPKCVLQKIVFRVFVIFHDFGHFQNGGLNREI